MGNADGQLRTPGVESFGGKMRFGALVALVTAATPFAILGVSSAFWAIIAGVAASAVAERQQLLEFWREGRAAGQLPSAQTSGTAKR